MRLDRSGFPRDSPGTCATACGIRSASCSVPCGKPAPRLSSFQTRTAWRRTGRTDRLDLIHTAHGGRGWVGADNVSVTTPELGSPALLGMSGLLIASRRRDRSSAHCTGHAEDVAIPDEQAIHMVSLPNSLNEGR